MVGKALGVGTVASLVLSLAIAKGGDIALPGGGDVVTGGSSVDFYSSDGSVESSWRGIAIDITAADTVTVGQSGGVGMEWEVDRIAFRHDGGILRLVTAADGGTTRLTVETLTMDSGGRIDISDGGNSLTVHSFTTANAGDITFSVGNGSSLMVTDQADLTLGSSSSSVDFLLDHGTSSFAGSVTLASGSLSAAGTSCFQVGGTGLGVGSTARISVADNGLLTIRDSSDAALGRLVVDGGELEIGNDATLAVGDLILRDVTFSAASGTGTLRSESLTTSGLVVDSDAVATVVSGATVVESGNYYVRGDSNRYAGGIIVQNSAQLSSYIGGAVIFLGDQDARQRLVMAEGATLRAWMGDLVIHHAAVEVVGLGVTVAATSGGNLDLSTSSLAIALAATDTVSIQPEDTITAGSYYQSGGIATVTASGSGHFTVLGTATITDGATYQVADSATQFAHGVTIADAVVAGITAAGSITVGDGDQAGDIFLAGGAVLLADTLSGHSLAVHENGSGSTLRVGGSNNAVYGKVDCGDLEVIVAGDAATDGPALWVAGSGGDGFLVGSLRVDSGEVILGSDAVPFAAGSQGGLLRSFGNVVVASGGSLASDHTSNYILSEWNSGTFQVADGGGLRTTAPLTVLGFDSFRLEGNFTAGWDTAASTPAVVMTDSDIIIGSTATFSLSSALAARAEVGMVLMETVGGRILAATDLASSVSMYGKVGYAVNGPGTTVVIDSLANVVTGDGSAADRAVAAANLRTVWGGAHIGTDLAGILYDAGFGRLAAQIDSAAGEKNLALFQAIASPAGGSVGRDSLEYLNGAHLYGFTAVAVSTARQFRRSLVDRLRSVAGAAMGPDPVSSDAAVAAIEDTDRRGDRMWLGSFGLWENAGSRGGFSGYRYDAHGFLGGYDTAVGEGLAVGGAFAYATGSYQDKGAAAHDSAITSYSVAAYGGYSHPAGMTASLFGAYAYADNSLRELRRDPGAGLSWSEADYRTDTWSLGGDWGWVLRPRTNVRISPTLGLHYIYTRAGDHDMALGGVVTQRERSIRQTGVFLPMEVNASYDLPTDDGGLFRLDAGLGYTYNFRSGGVRGSIDYLGLTTGASASVRSRDQNRHSGHAGLGLQYHRDRFAIGVRYACTVENSYHAHHLTGGVSLQF